MKRKIFNEDTLGEEITRVWGAYGAHMEVYGMLLDRLAEQGDLIASLEQALEALWRNHDAA